MALNPRPNRVILFAGFALLLGIALVSGLIHFSRQGFDREPASIQDPDPTQGLSSEPPEMPAGARQAPLPGPHSRNRESSPQTKSSPLVSAGTLQELLRNSQKPWQVDFPPDSSGKFPRALRQGRYLIQGDTDQTRAQDLLMTYSERTFGVPYSRLQFASTHDGEQTYISYEQTENELPVLGARIVLAFEDRSLVRVMNDLIPRHGPVPSSQPKVLLSDAEKIALAAAEPFRQGSDTSQIAVNSNPRLAYLPSSTGKLTLVYQTGVAIQGDEPHQLMVLIDARTGDVVRVRDTLRH